MTLQTIIGHQQQIDRLIAAVSQQRVAHAYLLSGPPGIGKKLVALHFARQLLCETAQGCGACSACHKVDSGSHPDLSILISEGSYLKIEQIRTLQQFLLLRPLEGRYKICLIDDAEKLTVEAANALLKTLEEPQPGTILLLISSRPEQLLPTIRSRCQQLRFSKIPRPELTEHLTTTLDLSVEQAAAMAAVADGSFTKILGSHQEFYLKKRPEWIQTLSALTTTSTIPLFAFAQALRDEKEHLPDILDMFLTFYRDLLLCQKDVPPAELINQDLLPLISEQSRSTLLPQLLNRIEAVTTARKNLARNVNPLLALEFMLLKIVHA